MPLPTELQSQVDYQAALEDIRSATQTRVQNKNIKLETLRMAKEVAMENHRNAPAGTVLTTTDILSIATDLESFTIL